jgi:vesicle-fusing ATPase
VIATTSLKSVLSELGLVEHFDSELLVPPITSLRSLDYVLREVELFQSSDERRGAIAQLQQAGFPIRSEDEDASSARLQIGVKKLLTVVEMARQEPDNVAQRLTSALMGLGM